MIGILFVLVGIVNSACIKAGFAKFTGIFWIWGGIGVSVYNTIKLVLENRRKARADCSGGVSPPSPK